jgi:hypothetical protein
MTTSSTCATTCESCSITGEIVGYEDCRELLPAVDVETAKHHNIREQAISPHGSTTTSKPSVRTRSLPTPNGVTSTPHTSARRLRLTASERTTSQLEKCRSLSLGIRRTFLYSRSSLKEARGQGVALRKCDIYVPIWENSATPVLPREIRGDTGTDFDRRRGVQSPVLWVGVHR